MESGIVKLWLDDIRVPPTSTWHWSKNVEDAIIYLRNGNVTEISLDHDLGDVTAGTGYTVACWLEQQAAEGKWCFVPKNIWVHSANPVGARNIDAAIASINRMRLGQLGGGNAARDS